MSLKNQKSFYGMRFFYTYQIAGVRGPQAPGDSEGLKIIFAKENEGLGAVGPREKIMILKVNGMDHVERMIFKGGIHFVSKKKPNR